MNCCQCFCQAQRDIIFELRRIAFDMDCESNNGSSTEKRKSMYTRDYKKLGFIVSVLTNRGVLPQLGEFFQMIILGVANTNLRSERRQLHVANLTESHC